MKSFLGSKLRTTVESWGILGEINIENLNYYESTVHKKSISWYQLNENYKISRHITKI